MLETLPDKVRVKQRSSLVLDRIQSYLELLVTMCYMKERKIFLKRIEL